jgi:hypothetical protein
VSGAALTSVSEFGVDLYSQAAYDIAASVFADPSKRDALVPCAATAPLADSCLTSFVTDFGLRVFRRPLDATEQEAYHQLGVSIGLESPELALEYVTAAMLQSPNFLYRVELGEADSEHAGWLHYTAYEIGTRLSFLLRNTIPDAELLAAAASGALLTKDGIQQQATRLLQDAELTRQMVTSLFSEYLDLPKLGDVSFPAEIDPAGTLGASLQGEVLSLVNRVALDEAGDLRGLFTTRQTSVNTDLAAFYGLPAVANGVFAQVELPEAGPRAGILTTGGLLALHNRPYRTAPTIRGKFVRTRLLCGDVPPPPANVPPITEDNSGPTPVTMRQKLASHAANPACASCHQSMDPIGLGMEDFDQFGRYRTLDVDGSTLDNSGDLDGSAFHGARELGGLLAADPRLTSCLVRQMYRYASARLETPGEQIVLEEIDGAFAAGGYGLKPLLIALVGSNGFRYLKPEAP